jgi:8-oxo-dGTP pyrophosphatase MutT (NUDIX family)
MNFDPQKIFVGVIDFFAVLLPGGFLSYLARPWIAGHALQHPTFSWGTTEGWMIYLFCSYLLGHFIFLLGALLDQWIYKPFRGMAYWGQVDKLANGNGLSPRFLRNAAEWSVFFGEDGDRSVIQVERLKARALENPAADKAVNAFQWCRSVLSLQHPSGLVAVERLEADSKFFRSFVWVSLFLVVRYSVLLKFELVLFYGLMLLLALWRYIDERKKASQRAYWLVMALEASKSPRGLPKRPLQRKDGRTHAGGIVFRENNGKILYLLIEAAQNRTQWVLPKGRIDAGESPRKTAVREIHEETGNWVNWLGWVGDEIFPSEENPQSVRFYLMKLAEEGKQHKWPAENRQAVWLELKQAVARASFTETKRLLCQADKKRILLISKATLEDKAPKTLVRRFRAALRGFREG